MKTAVGSELSLVSGTYHENFGSVVMEMASFSLKIRHVFGDTSLTERSIGAGPPVIIQLSGHYPQYFFQNSTIQAKQAFVRYTSYYFVVTVQKHPQEFRS